MKSKPKRGICCGLSSFHHSSDGIWLQSVHVHTPLDSKLHSHVYLCGCKTGGVWLLCGYTRLAVEHQLHIFECVNAPLFNYFIDFLSSSITNHNNLTGLSAFAPTCPPAWWGVLANPQTGSDTCTTVQPDFSPEQSPGSTSAWPSPMSAGFLSRPESQPNGSNGS